MGGSRPPCGIFYHYSHFAGCDLSYYLSPSGREHACKKFRDVWKELPDIVNKNKGHPVKCELQINNKSFFRISHVTFITHLYQKHFHCLFEIQIWALVFYMK